MKRVRSCVAVFLWIAMFVLGATAAAMIVTWHVDRGHWWMLLIFPFAPVISFGMSVGALIGGNVVLFAAWVGIAIAILGGQLGKWIMPEK